MKTFLVVVLIWCIFGCIAELHFKFERISQNPKSWVWWFTPLIISGPIGLFFIIINVYLKYKINKLNKIPMEGHYIRITWLPNSKNHPTIPNAYIGMEGEVTELKEDGSFVLKGHTSILIVGCKYKYEYISTSEYFDE